MVVLVSTTLFYLDRMLFKGQSVWKVYGAHFLYALYLWEAHLWILKRIRWKYPTFEETRKRIIAQLVIFPLSVAVMVAIGTGFFDVTQFWDYDIPLQDYLFDYAVSLLFMLFVAGMNESVYLFKQWRLTTIESEEIKQRSLQKQLDSLKNKVNPHFLFNALNSLSSLIEEDEDKASIFVDELAQVYRYLLQNNEAQLTSLKNELDFIEAYFFLMQTRFGEAIHLDIDVSEKSKKCLIPPLTLQLLVENAVKHNITTLKKPLKMRIFDQNTEGVVTLTMVNNLQKKRTPVVSTQTGLANILNKYNLLRHETIEVIETEDTFKVVLPLINN